MLSEVTSQARQERMQEHEEAASDVDSVARKIRRARRQVRKKYEEKPTNAEVVMWYLYELCSYFVHTVLIPIVFPLIISQTVSAPVEPKQGWLLSFKDLNCNKNQMQM